ncbi:MAG: glycoside hydrolase family 3 C-terminal domain-containing protein [Polyangiales bacterium]
MREADAVVVVTGLDASDEGEGEIGAGDREGLALRATEAALIRAAAALNPRVVVVLEGGAAITPGGWSDDAAAVLFGFYPGAEGGAALAEVLYGDVSPSGRLPFTIPAREEDLPAFDNASATVTYGMFHGYRHLARAGVRAAWPFGRGLSYTSFAYGTISASRPTVRRGEGVTVTVRVTNTGSRRGRETVQLYATARGSAVARAPRDLRAFAQVELDPGASEAVSLELRGDDLAYWDTTSTSWVLEPVEYALTAAPDAEAEGVTVTVRGE